jgi:hypothetical protein
MVTNDLGACEWFVWDLRRSGLIDRGQLDQIVSEFLKKNPRAEAPALAEYLVQHGTLTGFQADRILNGKTQGLVLGPYVLLDSIGQGSMGQVYKATSKNDNQPYAVKVLPRRSMWNVRLARRQVRSFGQFSHPAVVPFVDVGTAGGLHYLVWPLANGQSLEAAVNQAGRLGVAQTALIGLNVAQGLTVAHQNNLFHGLIKASNILVSEDNQARILDFGIGSLLVENEGESLVDTMSTANTLTSGLDCASPESILEPTNRTPAGDQYSLGCVLYFCLTGRVPFPEGSAVEKMMAHQTKDPMPIKDMAPEVPDGLVEVIAKLMAKKPEDRFSGCDEVVEALEPYLGEMAEVDAAEPAMARAGGGSAFNRGGIGGGSSGRMPGIPSAPIAPSLPGFPSRPASTPAPVGRDSRMGGGFGPSAARSSQAGGGFGGGPSPVGRASTAGFGGNPSPVGRSSTFGGAPMPVQPPRHNGPMFPSRASFQLPPEDEIPLTPALNGHAEPPPFADPTRMSIPGGWVPGAEPQRRQAFGTLGIIAATMILMTLAYMGAQVLMQK